MKRSITCKSSCFSSDKQLADLADEIAQPQGQNVKRGLICSGDSFINSEEKLLKLKLISQNVTAVEMEATAIAKFVMPLTYLCGRSGNFGCRRWRREYVFEEFLPLAAKQSSALILGMIDRL